METPTFSAEQLAYLRGLLRIECCHTTGMHDPCHFDSQQYVCSLQKAEAWDRAAAVLGVSDSPHDAVPADDCFWCHDYARQSCERHGAKFGAVGA